jgi:phosphoribosyl 1,2-cyclic phosphodiesterase
MKTAMEMILESIEENPNVVNTPLLWSELKKVAFKIEKEQIIITHISATDGSLPNNQKENAEIYYNQTYNQNK